MRKKLLTIAVIAMMAALTACEGNKAKPSEAVTPTGAAAPTEAVTPTQETTPAVTATPTVTSEPTPEPTPVLTPEPIPAGFSDKELEERAKKEAAEMKYAYKSENVFDGCSSEFWALGVYLDPDKWNKLITYYDADGNQIALQYFLNGVETESVINTHFGSLHTVKGETSETKWEFSGLPYTETDEQGRKTVELDGWRKTFYEYDQNGNLTRKLIYEGNVLLCRELYTYDEKGTVLTGEIYWLPNGESNRKYLKKTYSEGRLVLCEVDTEDIYWIREMIPMPDDNLSYTGLSQVSYDYDETGAMLSMEIRLKYENETTKILYSYTRDEKGRITEATETDTDYGSKSILKIKYFDNGPIMVVPMRQGGDGTNILGEKTVAFFPTEELKTMLETGIGISYAALLKEKENMDFAKGVSWPEELNPMFDERFRDLYVFPKEGRPLATISEEWGDATAYKRIVENLLGQKNFPLDKAAGTMTGGYSLYKNDRLVESSYYCGGGGPNEYEKIGYDNAGRVVSIEKGSEDAGTYKFTYDKAGHVLKLTYTYEPPFESGYFYKGTATYTYDAEGKATAVNGDFTGEPRGEFGGKAFRQTFRLTACSGNVIE